jgi:long-chain acyl-CoA synthetase
MEHQNLTAVFENTVKKNSRKICFRYVENGIWTTMTWEQARERVQKIAGGLRKLGVHKGDRVAIVSRTRVEWTLVDLAIMAAGGVTVPIYESNIPEQVEYILADSGAKVAFVENEAQHRKFASFENDLPQLHQIVMFDVTPETKKVEGIYSLDELEILGSEGGERTYQQGIGSIGLDDEASFVYTSGTTGNPKGAILTHGNFLAEVKGADGVFHFEPHFESLLFLPLAHIFARVVQFFQIYHGFIQCYAESIDKILDNIATVKPHFMGSVPRIFEKIHAKFMAGIEASPPKKKKIVYWALAVGRERSRLLLNRQRVPLALALKYQVAKKLVFDKLSNKLGGRIRYFISGGAPLAKEIAEFFHACGIIILEGYGLTETSAAVTVNTLTDLKLGCVGKPMPGTEFKIAADGEILVRGKMVFKGYYKNPDATREVINGDGWFHTGDIGEFDQEGFLRITDRKKDIIVTAGGKNIAPQNIENIMKTDQFISQFVVHGDKRKFLSALVTLDKGEIERYAKEHKIPYGDYDDLVRNEKIFSLIKARIEERNKSLAKYETIKRFAILKDDFSVESGELTPTLKIKRKVISQRYQSILDGFYQDGASERD